MILINEKTGKPVKHDDIVTSFRGVEARVTGWDEPHKASSTGRIYVKEVGASAEAAYFPGVFGCKFVEEAQCQ